jgi:HAE1 family hydrophobic/amphiphilic exporter-1
MTSFAFILGCVPLWFASGSGSVARRVLGTVVISGMLTATLIAIFIIPALFVIIERSARKKTPVNQPPPSRIPAEHLPQPRGE